MKQTIQEEFNGKVPKKSCWEIYTKDEKEYYKALSNELWQAVRLLEYGLAEYDDRTYQQQYDENRKADLGYNEPATKDDIAKVTTGLTREKVTTIESTVLGMNLQPNITAFDKSNYLIAGLGQQMEGLVKKTRELEHYDEKRKDIYRELIAQGEVYVEEDFVERLIVSKEDTNWTPTMKISEYKNDNKPIYDVEAKAEVKLHLGKYVLTSSMTEKEINNNALVATYEEVDRSEAESVYGKWDRWEYVPLQVDNTTPFSQNTNYQFGSDYIWNTYPVAKGKVGITKVYHRFKNRYMIIINGVMMLPIHFPLTKRSPSGLIPIAKGVGETIPNFRSGKGIPAKTRVDQKLYDTLWRAMAGKAWQSFRPALGTRAGNILTDAIVKSNTITAGVKQGDIFTILPTQLLSLNNSDISMFQLAKEVINEKSVTDSYAGQAGSGNQTATEIVNQQKQTMLKLTDIIDGIRQLEKRLIHLRIANIVTNYTKSETTSLTLDVEEVVEGVKTMTKKVVKEKKYKRYTIDDKTEEGRDGYNIVEMHGNDFKRPSPREQIKAEDKLSEKYGRPTRVGYMNADLLRELQIIWNVSVIISPEEDTQMELIMFLDNLTRVANLIGIDRFNIDTLTTEIAIKMGQDPDKLFKTSEETEQNMMQLMNQAQGNNPTQVANPAQQAVNSQRPSPLTVAKTM